MKKARATRLRGSRPELLQAVLQPLDLGLEFLVLGREELRVERNEAQEGLGRRVVVAAVVGQVESAHVVHGRVDVRHELGHRASQGFLQNVIIHALPSS